MYVVLLEVDDPVSCVEYLGLLNLLHSLVQLLFLKKKEKSLSGFH